MHNLGTAHELRVTFGDRKALDNVSFALSSGVTALVGANGAGKSTLMSVMGGGRSPSGGSFRLAVGQAEVAGADRLRRHTALMPQVFRPPAGVRLGEFMAYVAWARGIPGDARKSAIRDSLTQVGLLDRAKDKMGKLSGGMQRRALLAQALLGDPALLLLDEPTEGLDPENRARVRELIRNEGTQRGVLVSSHLMDEVADYASRIIVLDEGRLLFAGSTAELLAAAGVGERDDFALETAYLRLRAGAAGSTVSR